MKRGKMCKIDDNAGGKYKSLKEVVHMSVYLAILCAVIYIIAKTEVMLLLWISIGVPIGLFVLTACMLWCEVNQ